MDITLNADGPHSHDYTRQVGDAFDEVIRVLVYATMGAAPAGLPYPALAYELLGNMYSGVGRLDQLFGQISRVLANQQAAGRLRARGGRFDGQPDQAVQALTAELTRAALASGELYKALTAAQSAIAAVSLNDADGEPV